jgi:hypothetical protein
MCERLCVGTVLCGGAGVCSGEVQFKCTELPRAHLKWAIDQARKHGVVYWI